MRLSGTQPSLQNVHHTLVVGLRVSGTARESENGRLAAVAVVRAGASAFVLWQCSENSGLVATFLQDGTYDFSSSQHPTKPEDGKSKLSA